MITLSVITRDLDEQSRLINFLIKQAHIEELRQRIRAFAG